MELHFFTGKQPGFEQAAAIRQAVFVEEQGFHNEFDETDETCLHCVICDGEQPVATCRAFAKGDESGRWIIGRVAVSLNYRGQHQGNAVMNAMLKHLSEQGVREVEISAQCRAAGFYEKLGFRSTGETHMDECCPHVTMLKTL